MSGVHDTDCLAPVVVTAVGSMPHKEASPAVQLILDSLSGAPHPPQLPFLDPREQMWIQFSEGLPRFKVDLATLNYYFDTTADPQPEVEEFYARYLEVEEGGSAEHFDIGPDYGTGIRLFGERIAHQGVKRPLIKVQVTGPLSFALTVTDETRRPIFYHPLFRDVAVKGIGLKAVRLLELFKPLAESVIVMFDEPSLCAYGSSAFLGVSKTDVIESLDDVMSMVAQRGGIPGVHCCGNTDWGLLMETSARILNFDAVDYADTIGIYAPQVGNFLDRGGVLAWGAVPNTERIETETAQDVIGRIGRVMRDLEAVSIDREMLTRRLIITPACGCASLTQVQTEKVYRLLAELEQEVNPETFRDMAI